MAKKIEVFQDMRIQGPLEKRSDLRLALIAAAIAPWRFDLEKSDQVARNAGTSEDVLLFRCEASTNHPAAGLTLWGIPEGYYVPNIVPMQNGSLSFSQYNAVLQSFLVCVVQPIVEKFGFEVSITKPSQDIDDWLSLNAATKLRRFSGAANKSTGASHPMDKRRWFDFIIAVHRNGEDLGSDRLARWLHEIEGWDEETAHDLAGDFENALTLLTHYDEN
ncbi:hypothetical protein ACFOWX_09910 [Sphingorhabdus arenilitoris]|uniref:Uncharacterized protein n=1 Tax=Sphingorhabdus arenilitoris TaxID=1490041 RepID=A0ABV8RKF4_9SPHN